MPPTLAKLREKLQTSIFDSFGSTATLISVTATSTDKWGDVTSTETSTSITVVPYDMMSTEDFQPFGDLQSGEITVVMPYSVSFDTDDKLVYDSSTYIIKETVTYPYANGVLAYAVRLAKEL